MAVYRKKQPARRPVRRGWKRHARTGMFLFAFALVAVTVGVILPHAGVMSAAAEGSTLTEKIFTTVQNKNLPVIAIDPGHGGTDPGSEGSGLWEYEMTWQVANELVNLLEQDGRYAPVLTITEEESQNSDMPRVEPAERAQRANDAGAVLLFSIHGNSDPSGTASGFECYAIPPGQQYHDESVALARLTAQKITQTGQPLRGQDGVRYIYFDTYDNRMVYESSDETPRNEPTFRLLTDADCPAVLVEQCFLTNPQDAARLATPSGAKQAAKAYYEAICEWMEGR
jgi:N-acetylmuramoyl-L-alanine amidase